MGMPRFPTRVVPDMATRPKKIDHSVFLGKRAGDDSPVITDRKLFNDGHVHLRGESGSGKSSLILGPLILKMMEAYTDRNGKTKHDSIFVFDFGNDTALFNRVRERAEMLGRRFKYFNMDPTKSFTFDPFQAVNKKSSRPVRLANLWMSGLNLEHGGNASADAQFFAGQNLMQVLVLVEAAMRDASSGKAVGLKTLRDYLDQKHLEVKHADSIRTNLELLLR